MSSSSIPSLGSSTSSSIDTLVSQYITSISQPVYALQSQQAQTNSLVSTYNDLKTKLTDFESQVANLKAIGTLSPLAAKAVSSSGSTIVSATAKNTATSSTHSLLVTQLAKYDTLVSTQLSQSGTNISGATGAGTFTFSVNGSTPNISVHVSAGDTNATVMANMAAAVNSANIGVTATVINDTSSTARLVFTSKNSGSTNAVTVSDVSGTLAASVGWTSSVISSRTASTPTNAGFVNSSVNSLDSNFTLDGIPIVRSSNTVSDVLTGVTFNLTGTQLPSDDPVTVTVSPDTKSIQSTIQNFINSYNTLITDISQNITDSTSSSADGTAGSIIRGPLAGDVSFMNLQLSLQDILMSPVTSAKNGNPNNLSAIGIKLNNDGTLSIGDQSTLTSTLTSNPTAVSDLFNSSSGIAVQLDTLVKSYSRPGGTMDQKINGAQDQISSMNDQINSMQNSINIQADAMRKQFTSYESILLQLNQTQTSLTSIWNAMSAGGLI